MGVPLRQSLRVGAYVLGKRLRGEKRYPLVLMLEPLFRCNLACAGCGKIDYPDHVLGQAHQRRGRHRRGRGMRRAHRVHRRRRAPDPQGDAADRARPRRARAFRLPVHERAAARQAHRGLRALAPAHVLHPPRRRRAAPRRLGLPGRGPCEGDRGDTAGEGARVPRHRQRDVLPGGIGGGGRGVPRRMPRPRRRGRHRLARVQLRAGPPAGRLPRAAYRDAAVPGGVPARAAGGAGVSIIRACTWTSSPGTAATSARRGATRRATSSAGSALAICSSARATPEAGAS